MIAPPAGVRVLMATQPIDFRRKHLPAAPGHWEEFFARAFALDPADRPTTARMFLSQLGRAFS